MKRKITMQQSQTDWNVVDAMDDKDIDLLDVPEVSVEQFAQGVVRKGLKSIPNKSQITLRIDTDVLSWFKSQGKGYQTSINALLKEYMKAHLHH